MKKKNSKNIMKKKFNYESYIESLIDNPIKQEAHQKAKEGLGKYIYQLKKQEYHRIKREHPKASDKAIWTELNEQYQALGREGIKPIYKDLAEKHFKALKAKLSPEELERRRKNFKHLYPEEKAKQKWEGYEEFKYGPGGEFTTLGEGKPDTFKDPDDAYDQLLTGEAIPLSSWINLMKIQAETLKALYEAKDWKELNKEKDNKEILMRIETIKDTTLMKVKQYEASEPLQDIKDIPPNAWNKAKSQYEQEIREEGKKLKIKINPLGKK